MVKGLRPCPFCDGRPDVTKSYDEDGCMWTHVKCLDCGARTRGRWVSDPSNACPIHYAEVRDEWNRRPAGADQ